MKLQTNHMKFIWLKNCKGVRVSFQFLLFSNPFTPPHPLFRLFSFSLSLFNSWHHRSVRKVSALHFFQGRHWLYLVCRPKLKTEVLIYADFTVGLKDVTMSSEQQNLKLFVTKTPSSITLTTYSKRLVRFVLVHSTLLSFSFILFSKHGGNVLQSCVLFN